MKHSRTPRRRLPVQNADVAFQIAPFVDIVFVILLFYLVKAAGSRREMELRGCLPTVECPVTPTGLSVQVEVVTIGENGGLEHNGESIPAAELTNRMSRLRQQSTATGAPLLVSFGCDAAATYADLANGMAALNRAGVFHLTLEPDAE